MRSNYVDEERYHQKNYSNGNLWVCDWRENQIANLL